MTVLPLEASVEDATSYTWTIAVILGPIILAAALVYGTMHYRKRGRGPTAPRSYDHSTEPPREIVEEPKKK